MHALCCLVLVVARLACLLTLTVIVAGSSVASGASSPSGLVAAYSFDAGSGSTLTDISGNGNSGSITGAVMDRCRQEWRGALLRWERRPGHDRGRG